MIETNNKRRVIQMHPKDNVLVALQDLAAGENVLFNGENFILSDTVKAKHKFYIADLTVGSEVYMYGVLVGKVQHAISKGSLMTTENL